MAKYRVLTSIAAISIVPVAAFNLHPTTATSPAGTINGVTDQPPIALHGVAALSGDDAWAVGRVGPSSWLSYAQHWNGSTWMPSKTPRPGLNSSLEAVDALSANDVWAVGWYYQNYEDHPLTLHWDGHAWTTVATPAPKHSSCAFATVSALPGGSVWAAGRCAESETAIIEHWDGTGWGIVDTVAGDSTLTSISAASDSDVWTTGALFRHGAPSLALVLHWDGAQWKRVKVQKPARWYLQSVSDLSATDAWAVGRRSGSAPLGEHWDGTAWTPAALKGHRGEGVSNTLDAVSLDSATKAWAVGEWADSSKGGPLIERWDGTTWTMVPGPEHDSHGRTIGWTAVASDSPTDAWAVGRTYDHRYIEHGVIAHWDGTSWELSWSEPVFQR